ncbi:MAG TPA: protease modulator HflC [Stellaceae bacterium]|jgi:membrane protease subunit HflC|nr:protease modulator HflC [Stellaceae bacterium]
MNRRLLVVVGAILIAAGFFATTSFFIVDQTEQALVLRLGEVRRVIRDPGLQLKQPFVENVVYYDKRILDFEPPPEEVIVSDQKRLVIDSYTRYRIANPLMFYQTAGNESGMRARLTALVSGSLRRVLGNVTLSDILSQKRAAIMRQIRDEVAEQAKSFGIVVVDVRLRRADLPEENNQAIYARMQSEREQQARQYRGEGAEAAQTVRANAERERTVILAEAQRDGQRLRGEGDAQAVKIYADAFSQDKQFFAFYRSLQAYRNAFNGRDTSFVLSPEGNFFRFFQGPSSTSDSAAAASPSATPPGGTHSP